MGMKLDFVGNLEEKMLKVIGACVNGTHVAMGVWLALHLTSKVTSLISLGVRFLWVIIVGS
jgi:hypothetical protein